LRVIHAFRVSSQQTSAASIRSIEFSRRGRYFLVNTADRVIRVYQTSDVMPGSPTAVTTELPEPVQKLQDLVNK
jgi:COMPASS component SWD1